MVFQSKGLLLLVDTILVFTVFLLSFMIFAKISEKTKQTIIENPAESFVTPTQGLGRESEKSGADVSYIVVTVTDRNSSIELINEEDERVGTTYIEGPIADPLGELTNTAEPINTYNLAKPASGYYALNVNLTKDSYIDIYLYDRDGESKINTIEGRKGEMNFAIDFDKNNVENSMVEAKSN